MVEYVSGVLLSRIYSTWWIYRLWLYDSNAILYTT